MRVKVGSLQSGRGRVRVHVGRIYRTLNTSFCEIRWMDSRKTDERARRRANKQTKKGQRPEDKTDDNIKISGLFLSFPAFLLSSFAPFCPFRPPPLSFPHFSHLPHFPHFPHFSHVLQSRLSRFTFRFSRPPLHPTLPSPLQHDQSRGGDL